MYCFESVLEGDKANKRNDLKVCMSKFKYKYIYVITLNLNVKKLF